MDNKERLEAIKNGEGIMGYKRSEYSAKDLHTNNPFFDDEIIYKVHDTHITFRKATIDDNVKRIRPSKKGNSFSMTIFAEYLEAKYYELVEVSEDEMLIDL